jgi:phosphatidate cytidylyltransferase
MSNLRRRFAVAGVGVPLCGVVVFAGGLVFAVGLGLVAAVGVWEFGAMFRAKGQRTFIELGSLGAFLFPPVVYLYGFAGGGTLGALLLMGYSLAGVALVPTAKGPITAAALTSFGALYIGGLLSFGVTLREGWVFATLPTSDGPTLERLAWTLFFFYPVVVTWLADTAAYFGGRAFGRHKMSPDVSPNKTVEGAVAAMLAAPIVAALYARWVLPSGWGLQLWEALLFGLVVSGLAIFGDLVESAMKRECGVKDASNLLPGHGGMLDRLDSILWVLPGAYLFFTLLH